MRIIFLIEKKLVICHETNLVKSLRFPASRKAVKSGGAGSFHGEGIGHAGDWGIYLSI